MLAETSSPTEEEEIDLSSSSSGESVRSDDVVSIKSHVVHHDCPNTCFIKRLESRCKLPHGTRMIDLVPSKEELSLPFSSSSDEEESMFSDDISSINEGGRSLASSSEESSCSDSFISVNDDECERWEDGEYAQAGRDVEDSPFVEPKREREDNTEARSTRDKRHKSNMQSVEAELADLEEDNARMAFLWRSNNDDDAFV